MREKRAGLYTLLDEIFFFIWLSFLLGVNHGIVGLGFSGWWHFLSLCRLGHSKRGTKGAGGLR